MKLIGWIFGGVGNDKNFAELQVLAGRVEVSVVEKGQTPLWSPAYSENKILEGDALRTQKGARAALKIFGSNVLFLDEGSELIFEKIKSGNKKIVEVRLAKGRLWAKVSSDDFGIETKSKFTLKTEQSTVYVRGTIFDIESGLPYDIIRLIKGKVDVEVLTKKGGTKKDIKNISVGVGQKLTLSESNIEKIRNGETESVLEIIDQDFIESDWHLGNLEQFEPGEVSQIRKRIEMNEGIEGALTGESDQMTSPVITSPQEGAKVLGSQDAIEIAGTTSPETMQIIINGYTLTKFQPGEKTWSYFATRKFGTLVPGENKFEVVAVSKDGKKSPPATITIFAEPGTGGGGTETSPSAEKVDEGTSPGSKKNEDTSSSSDFPPPVVTFPPSVSLEAPYQTSSDVVTITGTVPAGTEAVEVNGFRLKKFNPASGEFKYIANARIGQGNMKQGENVYEIVAIGPNGKRSITRIKIIYSPVSL